MLKMLIDLKVTNGIHSSEFAKSHNMPPNQMESTGRHASQSLDWGNKSFASQYNHRLETNSGV